MMLWPDFMWQALFAGIGIALLSGPLGAFVVWRRMAYFGDTLAHAGLVGIVVALVSGFAPLWGALGVAVGLAILLTYLQQLKSLASDTLLGILAHISLAIGLLLSIKFGLSKIDLLGLLYGDLLAIEPYEVVLIWGLVLGLGLFLKCCWSSLLLMTLHSDLAAAEGIKIFRLQLAFAIVFASIVAISIKLAGVLLTTGLLIIPAAASRFWANSPLQFIILTTSIALISMVAGLQWAFASNVSLGPMIILSAGLCFVGSLVGMKLKALITPFLYTEI